MFVPKETDQLQLLYLYFLFHQLIHNLKLAYCFYKNIYLKLDDIRAGGWAIIEPIRNALIEFKRSGKFIIAHGNSISQKAYYLGTAADSIFVTPTGDIEFKGLVAELTFFKKNSPHTRGLFGKCINY